MRYTLSLLIILFTVALSSCVKQPDAIYPASGDFWKKQGINQVLDCWAPNLRDTVSGGFNAFLDRKWQPYNGSEQYPGMISRHLFSFSVGYLLTGDGEYLHQAGQIYDYMIKHGWDSKYGGWYNALDNNGNVLDSAKDGFYQPYAITGLVMYYFVTHDKEVLDYIEQSNDIMEMNAWDHEYGGYYRSLNRDLAVQSSDKDFSPQLAPVSGYLIYLYLATRDRVYLEQMEKIMATVNEKMSSPTGPWILERFDRKWNYTSEAGNDGTELNTGHNIEIIWMLLRLYELTEKKDYLQRANELQQLIYKYGFAEEEEMWYHKIGLADPAVHKVSSPWWIQAYGNMCSLSLYNIKREDRFLEFYRKGTEFWNRNFIDNEYGGAYLSVNLDGSIDKGNKAVRSKTSYHSMEHAMVNYIYTSLLSGDKSVKLHFKLDKHLAAEKLYPLPLETKGFSISQVSINGEQWNDYEDSFICLPSMEQMNIEVIIRNK
ncbi:MAG: AGE family epimerase/isomerase [Bacteroidales bacterium]